MYSQGGAPNGLRKFIIHLLIGPSHPLLNQSLVLHTARCLVLHECDSSVLSKRSNLGGKVFRAFLYGQVSE